MTNGQIAQAQELVKCWNLTRCDRVIVTSMLRYLKDLPIDKYDKAELRRLWHQYRHQIAAMKKNRASL